MLIEDYFHFFVFEQKIAEIEMDDSLNYAVQCNVITLPPTITNHMTPHSLKLK